MGINIDYGNAGLLGSLAASAGAATGTAQRKQAQRASDLQFIQLSQQAQQDAWRQEAQNKAFELQRTMAIADREIAAQSRTPAADHIGEQAALVRQERQANQERYKAHLDQMRSSGTIDEGQYQKGILAVMTGNETLMQHILAAPKEGKPNISNAEEVDIIQQPFREKRRGLETRLQQLKKDVIELAEDGPRNAARQELTETQKTLEDLFAQEAAALQKWRTEGRGPAQTPTSEQPALPQGGGTISFSPSLSSSERSIMDYAKAMAGPDAAKVGVYGAVTQQTPASGKPLDLPTATAFLREAGGDRVKAEQLARARGYAF